MDPGDADILVDDDVGAEQLGSDPRFVDGRPVDRSAGDDRDEPARRGNRARDPGAAGADVLERVGRRPSHGRAGGLVGPGDEDAGGAAGDERRDDRLDLARRLSLGEHGFGSALAELAVVVDPSEAEIVVREAGEPLEPGGRRQVAGRHRLEHAQHLLRQTRRPRRR